MQIRNESDARSAVKQFGCEIVDGWGKVVCTTFDFDVAVKKCAEWFNGEMLVAWCNGKRLF